MAIPPLVLRIYADSTGVKKGVTQAQTQVQGLRASVVNNAGLIQQALVGGLVVGLVASVKAASDLTEAQNKSNVVFGQSAGVINTFADTSAEAFGIAKASALESAASFGAMFDSAGLMESAAAKMSVRMTALAADMGSFNNVPVVEMLEKLRSGLAGEAEPLRRFGVFISEARVEAEAFAMGMQQVNGKFTDAQKIQARYNIILQDTKKQQGDFQQTLGESLPNQIKVAVAQITDLAASFGEVLIPVIIDATKAINSLVGPLADVLGGIKSVTEYVMQNPDVALWVETTGANIKEGLAPGLQLLKDVFGGVEEPTRNFGRDIQHVGDVVGEVAERFSSVSPTANAFRTEMARGSAAATRFTNMTSEAFEEWATAAGEHFDAVGAAFTNLADKAKLTAEKVIQAFRRQSDNIRDYRENLQEVQSRNIPDALLQQLVDMGTEGAGILAELANASDRKFNQMVNAMQRARNENKRLLDDIQNLRDSAATPITFNVRFQQQDLPNPQQRHLGGPVVAGIPYLVKPDEEIFVPSINGMVVPENKLGRTEGKGGGVTIHVHGDVNDADQFERKVVGALGRAAARAS